MEKREEKKIVSHVTLVCKICGSIEEAYLPEDLSVTDFFLFIGTKLNETCFHENIENNDWEERFDSLLAQQELEDFEGLSFRDDEVSETWED